MKTCLRLLIAAQVIAVGFVGAAARAYLFAPGAMLRWFEEGMVVGFWAVTAGFPITLYTSKHSGLHALRRHMVLVAEVAILCAAFVAILPAIQ